MGLAASGAECSGIHGNPQKFSGPLSAFDGYGGQMVVGGKVLLRLQTGHPHGNGSIDILQGQTPPTLSVNCLLVRVMKPMLKGNTNW